MLREALSPLVDLVYPPRCPLCGEGVGSQSGLCPACWSQLDLPAEPSCRLCQRPLADGFERLEGETCALCLANPPMHDGMIAGTLYTEIARKLVLSFKHGRKIALAPMFARMIAARMPELEGEWIAVPVPLHRTRLWHRGYNQSALLAKELARLCGFDLMVDGLVRRKRTQSLAGMGRAERARAIAGAITANPAHEEALRGAQVMLVDDVLTSGATSDACIAALRQAGVEKVRIACFSRVLEEER